MSKVESVSGRQIRVTVSVEVFERITRTADALALSVSEMGARCVVFGVEYAIESRIGELEHMLATLKGEVVRAADQPKEKPPPRSKTARDAVARFERAEEPAKGAALPGSLGRARQRSCLRIGERCRGPAASAGARGEESSNQEGRAGQCAPAPSRERLMRPPLTRAGHRP